MPERIDHEALEAQWKAGERTLNRLYATGPESYEIFRAEIDALEAAQEEIEWTMGWHDAQAD